MAEKTSIAWTDHTFNPWHGCTEASPGCDHCYAKIVDTRWGGPSHWGKGVPRRTFGEDHWRDPARWNNAAASEGVMRKVFCLSMGDIMDDEAPDGARPRLWDVVNNTPWLLWQFLTKRPQRFPRYLPESGFAHDNVILMATVESQEFYASRITALNEARLELDMRNDLNRKRRSSVQIGVSYEPAIGPLSIRDYPGMRPHWIIFGGETGDDRRPMQEVWARNIRQECEEFGVSFFMKQMSAKTPGRAAQLIPVDMLVRQFPDTKV